MASDVAREIWGLAKQQERAESEDVNVRIFWGEWREILKCIRDGRSATSDDSYKALCFDIISWHLLLATDDADVEELGLLETKRAVEAEAYTD